MKLCRLIASCVVLSALIPLTVYAQSPEPAGAILFENVRVFDGTGTRLGEAQNVLVRGNVIERVTADAVPVPAGAVVIDGRGQTLMPGLIDAHAHLMMNTIPMMLLVTGEPNYLQLRSAAGARDFLLAGFTSARDLSGPVFGLKRAIDEGLVAGPRIWPSGPMISQTSGHADFRALNQLPGSLAREPQVAVRFGYGAIADGVPEVQKVVREQLMQGASQIKLAVGGGVSSQFDPIDVTQYSVEEIRAAVGAAEDWGTYVTVHAYTPRAVRRAIDAGVKVIDHGQLLDEPTIRLMAEKGVWLEIQPFLLDEDAGRREGEAARKYEQVVEGTDRAYRLAKKHGVKIAFGVDMLFNPNGNLRQAHYLAKLTRWFTPAEILKMATAGNAELLALSGPRNPYPGRLGVVEEGALADLLLVQGDPLADIELLSDPGDNLLVVMKDGKVYKNIAASSTSSRP